MIEKVILKYKENGFIGLLLTALTRLPGVRALCLYYVYRKPFYGDIDDFQLKDIYVVLANENRIEDLISIQNKADIFLKRFKMKHLCFVAYNNNEAVAYLWGQEGPLHVDQFFGFEVPIAENQFYYYDSHTRPDWRQKGLLKYMLQYLVKHSSEMLHKNELIAIVEVKNKVSQKAHEKIGFVRDRLQLFVNLFGLTYNFKLFKY